MASSAEAFAHFSGRPRFRLRVAIAIAQVDEANNRARWNWSLRVENLDGSTLTWSRVSADASMQVGGVYVYDQKTPVGVFDFRDGAEFHEWASGTTGWIQYNSDGTKTIPFRGAAANAGIFGAASAEGAVVADRINHQAYTGLSVSRRSDTQHTSRWASNGVYSSAVIQRRTNDGPWQQVGAPGGNVASFTDTTTTGNRKYEYRVAGRAANAQSGWSNTVVVYTTPAVPSGISATRQGSGIRVAASGRPPYATSYDVRDGDRMVGQAVAFPWTHGSPDPAVPHTYQARARNGSLVSGWSVPSNTVQLLTPPNAPGALSPNGTVVADDEDVTFGWTHNPVDSSEQTAYELRYREEGGAWTTLTGTGTSARAVSLPVGDHEWQVCTKGAHPDFGAWSPVAAFTVISRPGVAVTQPDTRWDASVLPVQWTFFQAQDRPQSGWEMRLQDRGDEIVETRSGSGATTAATLNARLTEGDWTVSVRAATGGVWSAWALAPFTVVFDPPAVPVIDVEWDEHQGGVSIAVREGAGESEDGDDGDPETVMILVERSIEGETWEMVAEVDGTASLIDWESLSYGETQYRATAFTSEGAAAIATATARASSAALWLSGGPGFGVTGRLPFDPAVSITAGRQRMLKQYAGRSLPVAYTGQVLFRTVTVSGRVTDRDEETADVAQLSRIAFLEEDMFLFRDPDGRRIYGSIGQIQMPRESSAPHPDGWDGLWGYSFTLTETEPR